VQLENNPPDEFGRVTLGVLTPDERDEFYRLYEKIALRRVQHNPHD